MAMTREEMEQIVVRLKRLAPQKVETDEETATRRARDDRQRLLTDCGVLGYELARRVLGT
jgi:hypothetical protein